MLYYNISSYSPPYIDHSMQPEIAHQHHNHSHCIVQALQAAKQQCKKNGVRLTAQREAILRLIWTSHQPLGAYAIISKLTELQQKITAPPTVYRALAFLEEQRLIHRLPSVNGWIGCRCPENTHSAQFLICQSCQCTVELIAPSINTAIAQSSKDQGFWVAESSVERLGLCPNCIRPNP